MDRRFELVSRFVFMLLLLLPALDPSMLLLLFQFLHLPYCITVNLNSY
jgi:hypothetical protein